MPDPRVLYIVTAVVVAGLVLWVILVLLRPAQSPPAPPQIPPQPSRPKLPSHSEIKDEPGTAQGSGEAKPGRGEDG